MAGPLWEGHHSCVTPTHTETETVFIVSIHLYFPGHLWPLVCFWIKCYSNDEAYQFCTHFNLYEGLLYFCFLWNCLHVILKSTLKWNQIINKTECFTFVALCFDQNRNMFILVCLDMINQRV